MSLKHVSTCDVYTNISTSLKHTLHNALHVAQLPNLAQSKTNDQMHSQSLVGYNCEC